MRIGARREAVTRELGYLSQVGILRLQRRRLEVLNPGALAHLANKAIDNASAEWPEAEHALM